MALVVGSLQFVDNHHPVIQTTAHPVRSLKAPVRLCLARVACLPIHGIQALGLQRDQIVWPVVAN